MRSRPTAVRAAAPRGRRLQRWLLASAALGCGWPGGASVADEARSLRLGGALGFGMTLRKQAGQFAWDWDSAREDTTLAEVKLEARPAAGVAAFVRFGARLDAFRADERPRFELSEASLRLARWVGRDSLGLRLFARQPSALWLDHGLGAPLDPAWLGDAVQGVRAGLADPRGILVVMAADRSGWIGRSQEEGPDDQIFLVRFRGDSEGTAGLRLGATYMRQIPVGSLTGFSGVSHRDLLGFDLRLLLAGVQAQVDYNVVSTQFEGGAVFAEIAEPGLRESWSSGGGERLTDVMPTTAALRAELRALRLGSRRWGYLGFAPAYRAVGQNHTNPAMLPSRAAGSPERGYEGYRLEAWYEIPQWPLWLRQAYDRHVQFRDADRRIIRQESEIEARLHRDVGARLRYTQTQSHDERTGLDEHADDLLTELRATHGATRFRVQWVALDLNGALRRDAFAMETGLRMSARLQLLGRATWSRESTGVRRAFFVELQYWHLPQFETALQVGSDWIGDAADPVLDPDVVAAADQRDIVRLHFRGWF